MFHHARFKLTAWYLFIIMLISILFSVAFYNVSTREIERLINRIEFRQEFPGRPVPVRPSLSNSPTLPTFEDLEALKRQLLVTLVVINGAIFIFAGGAGYFLAGRTLLPIKIMLDEQNQFISNASHELRTPIATLRAEMEGNLLEKKISDKKARKLITSNLEELGTLQDLSNSLLRIAEVNGINQEKYMVEISLLEIAQSAQKKILPLAKKKDIVITSDIKDSRVKGIRSSLVEVFVILLDNAIKYSREKTRIKIISEEQSKVVTISIADQGEGIPAQDMPHIFDRFFRSDKSRSEADGYGLGLSIAQKIVETHNGSLTAKSNEKKGTTFIVQLPLLNSQKSS